MQRELTMSGSAAAARQRRWRRLGQALKRESKLASVQRLMCNTGRICWHILAMAGVTGGAKEQVTTLQVYRGTLTDGTEAGAGLSCIPTPTSVQTGCCQGSKAWTCRACRRVEGPEAHKVRVQSSLDAGRS